MTTVAFGMLKYERGS